MWSNGVAARGYQNPADKTSINLLQLNIFINEAFWCGAEATL
jgi:hypothetical protein